MSTPEEARRQEVMDSLEMQDMPAETYAGATPEEGLAMAQVEMLQRNGPTTPRQIGQQSRVPQKYGPPTGPPPPPNPIPEPVRQLMEEKTLGEVAALREQVKQLAQLLGSSVEQKSLKPQLKEPIEELPTAPEGFQSFDPPSKTQPGSEEAEKVEVQYVEPAVAPDAPAVIDHRVVDSAHKEEEDLQRFTVKVHDILQQRNPKRVFHKILFGNFSQWLTYEFWPEDVQEKFDLIYSELVREPLATEGVVRLVRRFKQGHAITEDVIAGLAAVAYGFLTLMTLAGEHASSSLAESE